MYNECQVPEINLTPEKGCNSFDSSCDFQNDPFFLLQGIVIL